MSGSNGNSNNVRSDSSSTRRFRLSDAWIDFVAGWCSGAVSVVALQPLDTVLTRWQAQAKLQQSSTPGGAASTARIVSGHASSMGLAGTIEKPLAHPEAAPVSSSYLRVARSLTSRAGMRSLWRGASPMIGAVPFQNALLMGGYGVGQGWLDDPQHPDRLLAIFAGGCTGGILQSFLMSPVEFAKVSAQIQHAGAAPLTVRDMAVRVGGNLNVGLGATLLRDGVPHGVWFVSYEAAKQHLMRLQQQQREKANNSGAVRLLPLDHPMVPPLAAGAVAATVAWIVGYPADLIKTRLQSGASVGGIARTTREIIRDGGGSFLALYRGLGLKLVRAIPASMIGFGTYEYVKAEISSS